MPPKHSVSRLALQEAAAGFQAALDGSARKSQQSLLRLAALRVEYPNLRMGESPPPELHDRFYFELQFFYLSQYFGDASNGRLVVAVDVPDRVALAAHDQEYYGDFAHYDSLMVELTGELVQQFDDIVDFREYDGIILLHAGPGQESDLNGDSPLQIWSGYLDNLTFQEQLSTADSTVLGFPTNDGEHLVREVIVLPEWEVQDLRRPTDARLGALGVYCHEVGQKLGMIPLFDSDPSPIPDSQGVGNFGLMGYGLWVANGFIPTLPNAFNRVLMGWVDPIQVADDSEVMLRDYETGAPDSVVAHVAVSGRESFLLASILEDPDGPIIKACNDTLRGPARFFNFEDLNADCRFNFVDTDSSGSLTPADIIDTYAGAEWDFFMTDLIGEDTAGAGQGLLVLHVDQAALLETLRDGSSSVQRNPRRKAVDVEEADGIEDLDRFPDNARAFGSAGDYFGVGHTFGPESIPDTRSTNGAPTGLRIEVLELKNVTSPPASRMRVRVERGATTASVASPRPLSRRTLPPQGGGELVAWPLPQRLVVVVPGSAGAFYLVDEALDEAPAPDPDPTTLVPWRVLPADLAGSWSVPPAVGDIDADSHFELLALAEADSAATRLSRLFVWRDDGSEFVDPDGRANTAYAASFQGRAVALLAADLDAVPGDEVVVGVDDSVRTRFIIWPGSVCVRPSLQSPGDASVLQTPDGWRASRPAVVRVALGDCSDTAALAWVEFERQGRRVRLRTAVVPDCCGGAAATLVDLGERDSQQVVLLAGDLDNDGSEEIVLQWENAGIEVVHEPSSASGGVRGRSLFADHYSAPPALADTDGNGTLEILCRGARAMHVLSSTGASMPGWPYVFAADPQLEIEAALERGGTRMAAGGGTPLVADLDGDGRPEILAVHNGGALLAWDASGHRRRELEMALPAPAAYSALLADLDGGPGIELVASAEVEELSDFSAAAESSSVARSTQLASWRWPSGQTVAWGTWGGAAGHGFRTVPGALRQSANDPELASFVVAPNPAGDVARARIELTSSARVVCSLYNLEGERVHEAARDGGPGQVIEFEIDLRGVASGVYLARMQVTPGGTRVRPLVVHR